GVDGILKLRMMGDQLDVGNFHASAHNHTNDNITHDHTKIIDVGLLERLANMDSTKRSPDYMQLRVICEYNELVRNASNTSERFSAADILGKATSLDAFGG